MPQFGTFKLTDRALVYGEARALYFDAIEAITFEIVPLLRNRLPRAFYGIDTWVPIGFNQSNATAKFAVHMSGGETIWLSDGLDWSMHASQLEAVCAAAEYLHDQTFDTRFKKYAEQFQAEDRFSYESFDFFRSGDIRKFGKLLYNVHERGFSVMLGDFHVHFERTNTWKEKLLSMLMQSGHTIKISRNRDCFLSMYRLAYGRAWANEHYRDVP